MRELEQRRAAVGRGVQTSAIGRVGRPDARAFGSFAPNSAGGTEAQGTYSNVVASFSGPKKPNTRTGRV